MATLAHRVDSRRTISGLDLVGGLAAATTAVLLLLGVVGLIVDQSALGLRNWLVVLFQMNSGNGSLPSDPLRVFNPLDLAILALVGLTFLGLWPVFARTHRIWEGIAVALPFMGIPLLLITGQQGRSAVMSAGLIVAVLLFVYGKRLLGTIGIAANALLLVGDFGTGNLPGPPLAIVIGVGYVLLFTWFALLAAGFAWRRPAIQPQRR